MALQTVAYLVIQYADFVVQRDTKPGLADVSFLQYFDAVTRSFSWEKDGRPGEALGGWGYFIRTMEVAAFAVGGLIGPLLLMSEPYCSACRACMRSRTIATFAGQPPTKKAADRTADQSIAHRQPTEFIDGLDAEVSAGIGRAFRRRLDEWKSAWPQTSSSGAIVRLECQSCRRCGNGRTLLHRAVTNARQTVTTTLAKWRVDREFLDDATQ